MIFFSHKDGWIAKLARWLYRHVGHPAIFRLGYELQVIVEPPVYVVNKITDDGSVFVKYEPQGWTKASDIIGIASTPKDSD